MTNLYLGLPGKTAVSNTWIMTTSWKNSHVGVLAVDTSSVIASDTRRGVCIEMPFGGARKRSREARANSSKQVIDARAKRPEFLLALKNDDRLIYF